MKKGKCWQICAAIMIFIAVMAGNAIAQEESAIEWVEGPAVVALGENLAQLNMSDAYLFADGDDTRAVMEYLGNPPSHAEVGMIIPNREDENWFIVFEYSDIGYIRDDDRDQIDPAAILESYRRGTEEANEDRVKMGAAPIHVTGWYEEPFYNPETNNLTWAMMLEDDEKMQTVNYNIRILGRGGYMSAVLVADPERLTALKPELAGIVSSFSYKSGNRYAEYIQGDKLAKIGLTALIAGGAGAAAVKLGLFQALAKFWKAIVVGILAFFGGIWKFLKGIFTREEKLPMGGQPPRQGQ
jgi:uncharacterized membrane-anchored protein